MRNDILERIKMAVGALAHGSPEQDVQHAVIELLTGGLEAAAPDLPHNRRVSSVQAANSLRELSVKAEQIVTMFTEMPPNALHALTAHRERQAYIDEAEADLRRRPKPPAPPFLDVIGLKRFSEFASQAAQYLLATQDYGQGRPAKPALIRFVKTALDVYEQISGRRATITVDPVELGHPARGAFLDFVRSLLKIFEIDASAESLAKRAVKEKRSAEG